MQEEKSKTTRDAILDAAIELFIEAGFETTSMDAIALRANVAKGTLYYHFRSKEGIVEAIVERFALGAEEAFEMIVRDPALGPMEKLAAITTKETELNIASFSKLHRMKYIDIHLRTQKVMVSRFAPFYARIIEEGNAAGVWKAEYPLELAQITTAASCFLFDPECVGLTSERLESAMIDLTARGLGIDARTLAAAFSSFSSYVRTLPGSAKE